MIHVISNTEHPYIKSNFLELRKWIKNKSIVTIDSETRSTDFKDIFQTEMIMFQIGDEHDQWVIDTREYNLNLIKDILESDKILKIQHNIKYDYKVLKNYFKIEMNSVWDTLVAEQIIDCGYTRAKGYYSLQSTHQRYYNTDPYGDQLSLFDPFIPKNKRNEISKKANEPFTLEEIFYGATDIITATKVFKAQHKIVESRKQLDLMKLENDFALVLGDCELNGMPINEDRWRELAKWSQERSEEELEKLRTLHPEIANWNSHVQVKNLFRSLGINISKSIKGEDKDSIQATNLQKYIDKFDIIPIYLKYKGLEKLRTTYGIKFLENVNSSTGRIHSSFIQILNTGRTASTAPNLQNIKSAKPDFPEGAWWREAFMCKDNNVFIISDYSS